MEMHPIAPPNAMMRINCFESSFSQPQGQNISLSFLHQTRWGNTRWAQPNLQFCSISKNCILIQPICRKIFLGGEGEGGVYGGKESRWGAFPTVLQSSDPFAKTKVNFFFENINDSLNYNFMGSETFSDFLFYAPSHLVRDEGQLVTIKTPVRATQILSNSRMLVQQVGQEKNLTMSKNVNSPFNLIFQLHLLLSSYSLL